MENKESEIKGSDILLEMKNICKYFPGVKALDGVDLKVRRGRVHALMGENGAGKSTLMKCLFGIYHEDSGEILLDGKRVVFKNPVEALKNGVAMVHQELNQALSRSVMDNLWLGRYPTVAGIFVSEKKMLKDTERVFSELGISVDPKEIMRGMSVSRRQMAEIAKAVSYNAKIIVFDEPTSSLNETEAEKLFEIIEKLKRRGCAIIYISHKMEEILRISDEVTVMRDGRHIATKDAKSITTDEIIKLMVGREINERYPKRIGNVYTAVLALILCVLYAVYIRFPHYRKKEYPDEHGHLPGLGGAVGADGISGRGLGFYHLAPGRPGLGYLYRQALQGGDPMGLHRGPGEAGAEIHRHAPGKSRGSGALAWLEVRGYPEDPPL